MVPRFVASHGVNRLAIVGNVRQLGSWNQSKAVQLLPSDQHETMYTAIVQLPLGEKIEAKVGGWAWLMQFLLLASQNVLLCFI